MATLPAGSVTRRDGVLNISTHTPQNANPPDLGPKGYFSEISDDREDGQGSTKLHSQSKFLSRSVINVLTSLHLQWYGFENCLKLLRGLVTDGLSLFP